MRIQIEPTEHFLSVDGVPVRVWNGITEDGNQCFVMVHRIAVRAEDDTSSLERELVETPPPRDLKQAGGVS